MITRNGRKQGGTVIDKDVCSELNCAARFPMATLNARLLALEHLLNTASMLTLQIDTAPTPEQQATIDHCTSTNRRLMVFYDPGNTAWMPGCGVPSWGLDHA